jgi:citrate lyase subunit beta / citryl-CoA lyase
VSGAPALTWLYVPGDRPDRFAKAIASGADEVILDLEDAVAPARKSRARDAVQEFLADEDVVPAPPVQVRVNGFGTPWHDDDVSALAVLPRVSGLRLPKAESPDDVRALGARLPHDDPVRLHLLIESARGVEAAAELASAHRLVGSIALGEADLRSELGVSDERGLAWARGRIVVAAAATGLPPPAMSVYADVADDVGLAASCRDGRALGFLGRAAIHPRQLPIIEAAFLPDDGEIAEAEATLSALERAEAAGIGVAVLPSGRFVDRAMAERARRVIALARRAAGSAAIR